MVLMILFFNFGLLRKSLLFLNFDVLLQQIDGGEEERTILFVQLQQNPFQY